MSEPDPRRRVAAALSHRAPDRSPVDFLAVPEIWRALIRTFGIEGKALGDAAYYDPAWEDVLRKLDVDCRVLSYDQFCAPPESAFARGGRPEWWKVQSRSTPSRMWRWKFGDGEALDIFGRRFREQANSSGSYEENVPTLASAETLADVKAHTWPDPDWWDFREAAAVIRSLNKDTDYHLRYRMGSVFELAWQLRGMDNFLIDMAINPDIAHYMLERITDIILETTDRFLRASGDGVDMLYFYDDVAANSSLLISRDMWGDFIKPCHQKLIDLARKHGMKVMYHSDGALRPIIGDLVDMGVDLLNPIQPGVVGMEPEGLKRDFGESLSFHGGVDIIELLPKGSVEEVRARAKSLIEALGRDGGYIMASSHHIQSETPISNILALYDLGLR